MIKIIFCGQNSYHPIPCDIEHKEGLSNYLLLLVKTEAWFFLGDKRIPTKPNMVILFDRNTYIHYGCDQPNYNDDWIHFDMDKEDEEHILSSLNLSLNTPMYLPDIHTLSYYIQLISGRFHAQTLHWKSIAHSLMEILLYTLDEAINLPPSPHTAHKYYNSFSLLRSQLYNDPSAHWSGETMANKLCLSLSYFQHLYKDFFGLPCQKDIILARLEKAKFYLTSSDMPIGKLALFCGYDNELHFMRQFKKFEGLTPLTYRKNSSFFR